MRNMMGNNGLKSIKHERYHNRLKKKKKTPNIASSAGNGSIAGNSRARENGRYLMVVSQVKLCYCIA